MTDDKKLVPVWQPDGRILMQEVEEEDRSTETTDPKTKPRRKPRKDK
jgi:hypothetical protein